MQGPNIVTCKLQKWEARYYVVRCYLSLSDEEWNNLDNVEDTKNKMSRG